MELTTVCVRGVALPNDSRPVNETWVAQLQASMADLGLLQPIAVTPDGRLVFGQHRLKAAEALGWETIDAVLMTGDDVALELARCHENLMRNDLSAMERAEETARAKRLYEAQHPETKQGGAPGKAGGGKQAKSSEKRSFVEQTADREGVKKDAVYRDITIAEGLKEPAKAIIRDTPVADRKGDLLVLAKVDDPAVQRQAAELLVQGEAKSAQAAVAKATQAADGALFEAAGAKDDPYVVNSRLLAIWSKGVKQVSEGILELEPQTVARILPTDRHAETRAFVGEVTEWLEALVAALDAPLHVINGRA